MNIVSKQDRYEISRAEESGAASHPCVCARRQHPRLTTCLVVVGLLAACLVVITLSAMTAIVWRKHGEMEGELAHLRKELSDLNAKHAQLNEQPQGWLTKTNHITGSRVVRSRRHNKCRRTPCRPRRGKRLPAYVASFDLISDYLLLNHKTNVVTFVIARQNDDTGILKWNSTARVIGFTSTDNRWFKVRETGYYVVYSQVGFYGCTQPGQGKCVDEQHFRHQTLKKCRAGNHTVLATSEVTQSVGMRWDGDGVKNPLDTSYHSRRVFLKRDDSIAVKLWNSEQDYKRVNVDGDYTFFGAYYIHK